MSRFFRRAVVSLVVLIAFLQIIHFTLVARLRSLTEPSPDSESASLYEKAPEYSSDRRQKLESYSLEDVRRDRESMYKLLQSLTSVLDFSGEYRILKNFLPAQSLSVQYSDRNLREARIRTLDGFDPNENSYRRSDISLVTHSTVRHLPNLRLLSHRWSGLISVAVFVVSFDELPQLIESILMLRFCYDRIRLKTNFHLVHPLNITSLANLPDQERLLKLVRASIVDERFWMSRSMCTDPKFFQFSDSTPSTEPDKAQNSKKVNYDHQVAYPNNLLRNIAKRYSFAEYQLVIDIDLVPSSNLYENFLDFAARSKLVNDNSESASSSPESSGLKSSLPESKHRKVVFVLPTYEIDLKHSSSPETETVQLPVEEEDSLIPHTKQELLEQIKHKRVRPFYIELCWKCQKYTDYEAWMQVALVAPSPILTNISSTSSISASSDATSVGSSGDATNRIDVLYDVLWHDPWEPFYIGSRDVPFYDERFRQYGFNRISQVCELNVAEYRFSVLDNAFLVHKGFKEHNGFHPQKDLELERNRILFRQFKAELRERYPQSTRRC